MELGLMEIVYITLGVCILFYLGMYALLRSHRKKQTIKITGVKEENGVRYTAQKNEPVEKINVETGEKEANVTLIKEDVVLRRGYKYVVGPNNKIKPGKYTILTTEEEITEFNIRRNDYVRSYDHNSNVILAEGDELTCVNIPVILR